MGLGDIRLLEYGIGHVALWCTVIRHLALGCCLHVGIGNWFFL